VKQLNTFKDRLTQEVYRPVNLPPLIEQLGADRCGRYVLSGVFTFRCRTNLCGCHDSQTGCTNRY
jgi:hypothetical protein